MKLITELLEEGFETLTESTEDGKKNYFISGPFMQAELQNRNGRIYPGTILEREMKRYKKDFIDTKRALGELGHPNGPQINADRVCHIITEMTKDGNNFMGKAKVLDTPFGKILKNFIDEGVKFGVSTRGLGSVKPNNKGLVEVQEDFHLVCVDAVIDPSGPDCFVKGIMENTEFFYDVASGNWRTQEKLEETVKELKKEVTIRKKIDESKALSLFESFVKSIKIQK